MSLAEQQAQVLAALSGRGGVPPGFAADQVQRAAHALAHKRMHGAQRAWPSIASSARRCFAGYAAEVPLPSRGGPLADARFFVRWLAARGEADAALRRQALAVDLQHALRPDGLVPRRGICLRWLRLPEAGLWCIGLRLPGLGVRQFTFAVGRRRPRP
jgi:hypothetical protein